MRKSIPAIITMLLMSFTGKAQVHSFYVPPMLTNSGYATNQDSSYISVDTAVAANGRLLLFIGGTNSHPSGYTFFADAAAMLGYHSIIISYRDTPTVGSVCTYSSDSLCYDLYRQQVCFGTPVSTAGIDTFNSIVNRAYNLVVYLNNIYPDAGWGQFISGNGLVWSKIATAGHSQGSGHAMYLGSQLNCDRVLMFSGADDYSQYFGGPAHWETQPHATPANRLYGFLSLGNEGETYAELYQIEGDLGMIALGDTVDVDNVDSPYSYTHCLYTDATPRNPGGTDAYHGSTVANVFTPLSNGLPVFLPVWNYMLTDTGHTATGIATDPVYNFTVFPNPAARMLNIRLPKQFTGPDINIQLINSIGQSVLQQVNVVNGSTIQLPLPILPNGFYTIKIQNRQKVFQQPVMIYSH